MEIIPIVLIVSLAPFMLLAFLWSLWGRHRLIMLQEQERISEDRFKFK